MAKMIKKNTTLTHLQLSNTNLTPLDLRHLSDVPAAFFQEGLPVARRGEVRAAPFSSACSPSIQLRPKGSRFGTSSTFVR